MSGQPERKNTTLHACRRRCADTGSKQSKAQENKAETEGSYVRLCDPEGPKLPTCKQSTGQVNTQDLKANAAGCLLRAPILLTFCSSLTTSRPNQRNRPSRPVKTKEMPNAVLQQGQLAPPFHNASTVKHCLHRVQASQQADTNAADGHGRGSGVRRSGAKQRQQ